MYISKFDCESVSCQKTRSSGQMLNSPSLTFTLARARLWVGVYSAHIPGTPWRLVVTGLEGTLLDNWEKRKRVMYTHMYIVLINFKIGCVYIFYISPAIRLAPGTTKRWKMCLRRICLFCRCDVALHKERQLSVNRENTIFLDLRRFDLLRFSSCLGFSR